MIKREKNNNLTDYVTEKMANVIQAGAIPIYMGAPNVEPDWVPGNNSIIRTDQFESPKHLAEYLQKVLDDEELYNSYFEWKKKGLSEHFLQRYNDCVFYSGEYRICEKVKELVAKSRNPETNLNRPNLTFLLKRK